MNYIHHFITISLNTFLTDGFQITNNPLRQIQMAESCLQIFLAAAAAKSLQSCPTPCNPIDGSPPGSSIPRILQARTLELPLPSPMHACMLSCFSCIRLCATPWTAAHQAPLSMEVSRQEYWSGLPFPSPYL